MKILFIQPYLSSLGVLLDTLPKQLAQKGHELIVASCFGNYNITNIPVIKNIKFHSINALNFSLPTLLPQFPFFLSLDVIIKQVAPDIIHANNLPFLTTYQAVRIAEKMRIPSVIQVHGVTADRGFLLNAFQFFYLTTFGNKMLTDATKIICLTQNDALQVQSYGCSANKLCIIPNGVDINKFTPSFNNEITGLIVWAGRFVNEKGLTFLITAIDILVKNGVSDFNLLLIGDGPTKLQIQSQIRYSNLEKIVKLLPAVSHDKISEYLKQASIIVLPSLKEGMPYILLEAMASGKPVIGSAISGIKDVIQDGYTGLLVPSKDPPALADAILKLLNDEKLRTTIGQRARKLMVEQYSWSKITSRIEAVYDKLLYVP